MTAATPHTGQGSRHAALVTDLVDVLEHLNDGADALVGLQRLVAAATAATGAEYGGFLELGGAAGRVVAVSPGHEGLLGRPVDLCDPAITSLPVERCFEVPVAALPTELARDMIAHGGHRSLIARAELAGRLAGLILLQFADVHRHASGDDRKVARLAAAAIARLYGRDSTLSMPDDSPVATALADGLAVVTSDGMVLSWNPAAEELARLPADEAIGRPLPFPCPIPGQVVDHRLPDGRWIQLLCARMTDSDARIVTFRDVTDTKYRAQAREMFVAVTSHELRTPVTVIKGYVQMLTDRWNDLDDAARRDALRVVDQRARQLADLVDRLLVGAWSDAEPWAAPERSTDLGEAIRETVARLDADLRSALVVDAPDSLPRVRADGTNVATVLTELITNARKNSPDGGKITVSASSDPQTGYVLVADQGTGISPGHVERAFERFWQADGSDHGRPGVGLGLYLVRRIVERHGGWVSLRPGECGGTVAEVRLPRVDVADGKG